MTKEIKYLLLAFRLWYWLFENPGKRKVDSPYWDDVEDMEAYCPLCKDCLLFGCSAYSPWGHWEDAIDMQNTYKAKISAARIASLIRKRLKQKVREWLPVGRILKVNGIEQKVRRHLKYEVLFFGEEWPVYENIKYTEIDKLEVVKCTKTK